MSKSVLRAAAIGLLAAVVLAAPAAVPAQTEGAAAFYGIDFNASVGFAVPNTDEFGNSLYIRGGGGYELTQHLSLDVGLGWFSSTVDNGMAGPPPHTIADGEMDVVPLTASLQLRYPLPQLYGTLYGVLGLGYYFIDYTWDRSSKDYFSEVETLYGIPARQKVDNDFGFNLGAGFEYPLSAQFFVRAEGQYLFLSPEATGNWRDLITGEPYSFSEDLDLNTWLFSAGVKYLF